MLDYNSLVATFFMLSSENFKDTDLTTPAIGFGQIVSLLGTTIVVIILAYYSTRLIAKSRLAGAKSHNMKILESISIGFQNVLYLVKVGEKYLVISSSKDRVTFLSEVSPDALDFSDTDVNKQSPPFESVLSAFIEKHIKRGKGDEK